VLMRMSTLFVRTLRDDPADADVPSHKLLVRAGYVRRVAPGVYSWLPLGLAVLRNVEAVVREEMVGIGAQEVRGRSSTAAVGGRTTATACSACRTAGRPTTCWPPPTRSCSP
jgi:hypothetical protein